MSSTPVGPQIAIIGAGQVGAAAASALILGSVAQELLLVDVKTSLRDAQIQELSDVSSISGGAKTNIRAGTYKEAGQCDIVIITAGSKYSLGETSMQYMYRNLGIIQNIIPAMRPFRPDTILLVVSNPVDLLTTVAQQLSGLPPTQVLGSGTLLETVRLRELMAKSTGVALNSIDLYVLGVHGIGEIVAWSTATVGGLPLAKAIPLNSFNPTHLARECRQISQNIIQAKGAMPLGVGAIISKICSSILRDQRDILPVSHFQEGFGCCFSLPIILGRKGVLRTIHVAANAEEWEGITKSAGDLKQTLQQIKEGA